MKSLIVTLTIFLQSLIVAAQQSNPNYDSLLAKSLGADDYGMKGYTLVILKTGSNTTSDKSFIDSCY